MNDDLFAQMHQLNEELEPLVTAVAGYRAKLEASGFNETAAEMMACDYHRMIIESIVSKIQKE